jgi:PST family polysaccharide transporter/lipopolysaccharide exporter
LFTIGENWISTVPIIQILSIRCIFNSFGALRGPLWLSMGKPSLVAKYKYYRIILLIILIYPLTVKYGIIGTAFSISIVTFLMEIPEFIVTLKMLNKVE